MRYHVLKNICNTIIIIKIKNYYLLPIQNPFKSLYICYDNVTTVIIININNRKTKVNKTSICT